MHDLGNVEAWRGETRIRGGTYWGIPSEQVRDIAACIDFAEGLGFKQVVLVGHSAGANAVREYQAQNQDTRVAGVVLASGDVRPDTRVPPPEWVLKAKQFFADGRPEELVQGPFLSTATFLDILNRPPQFKDFFGALSSNAGVTRIQCPLLVLLGTNGDVGNEEDLELIKASIKRLPTGPSLVDTALIQVPTTCMTGKRIASPKSLRTGPMRCYQRTRNEAELVRIHRQVIGSENNSRSFRFSSPKLTVSVRMTARRRYARIVETVIVRESSATFP
jgi:pimeloyl-ACP methyl ester carboxylesterase